MAASGAARLIHTLDRGGSRFPGFRGALTPSLFGVDIPIRALMISAVLSLSPYNVAASRYSASLSFKLRADMNGYPLKTLSLFL